MKSLIQLVFLALTSLLLAACGGGGGSSEGGTFTPPTSVTVQVTAPSINVPSNRGGVAPRIGSQFDTELTVTVRRSDGTPVANGTTVTLNLSNSAVGRFWVPVGSGDPSLSLQLLTTVAVPTTGGTARVFFHTTDQTGTTTITASVQDPGSPGRTITGSITLNVVEGPAPVDRLVVELGATSLPSNRGAVPPRIGSEFGTQVGVRLRNADGTPAVDGSNVTLTVSDVSIGRLWVQIGGAGGDPADPQAPRLLSTVSLTTDGGFARAFVHTGAQTGALTITASAQDPANPSRTITTTAVVTVVQGPEPIQRLVIESARTSLPANRGASPPRLVSDFDTELTIRVRRADGSPVSSPVVLTVSNVAAGRLWVPTGTAGQPGAPPPPLEGTVTVQSVGGVARAYFHAGSQPGFSVITASVQDPDAVLGTLTATLNIEVTEGPAPGPRLSIEALRTTLPANRGAAPPRLVSDFDTELTVRVRRADGTPVADGTQVNLTISNVAAGRLWVPVGTAGQPGAPPPPLEGTVTVQTAGGVARAYFHAGAQAGVAVITASAVDPDATGNTLTASINIEVTEGPEPVQRLVIEPARTSLPANLGAAPPRLVSDFDTELTVRVRRADGSPVADGTQVNLTVGNVAAGRLWVPVGTAGQPGAPPPPLEGTVTVQTSGGVARAYFHTGSQPGVAVITASAQDPDAVLSTLTATVNIEVTEGPQPGPRLAIEAVRTTLPANTRGVRPFIGSPFLTEVTVTWRRVDGSLAPEGQVVNVSVNPVLTSGAFSTLDDPETEDVNEFEVLLGQGPVNVVAGRATIFFHSLSIPGTTTMTVTALDPDTNETIEATQQFVVTAVAPPLPATVSLSDSGQAVYVNSAGGNSSRAMQIFVADAAGNPVPDPVSGATRFNNLRVELVPQGASGGESLTGVNAQGQAVQGQAVSLGTTNGIANVLFRAGSQPGVVQVRVTADAADNNVDNGVIDPVRAIRPIIVSDGRLFSLRIASPRVGTIRVNRVDPSVEFDGDPAETPDPDGTYSLTVSVIATDRGGNPVLPGTPIQFGLIDDPISGFPELGSGFFDISGTDGNPEEGGQRFTAPGGQFRTAGGGAGPGDTLVVFGKEVPGNRDLESARTISEVLSETELRVTQRFNRNDDTGTSVDFGAVLPYVIGRAVDGNISTDRPTNEIGVATTKMNYPISRLGKSVIVWARGAGDLAGGSQELVTDTALFVYPGVAPATLSAGPSPLPRGRTSTVSICISDALRHPIQGIFVGFSVENAGDFVRVDGQVRQGTVLAPTGRSGCTVAEVEVPNFLAPNADQPSRVVFGVGGLADEVVIADQLETILQVQPQSILGDRGSPGQVFDLRLIDITGAPIPGAQLTVECAGSNGAILNIVQFPGITNSEGRTTARIIAENLDQFNGNGSGVCEFSTRACPTGCTASALVTFTGRDLCEFAGSGSGFSPAPPPGFVDPCGSTPPPPAQATVFVGALGPADSGTITVQPGGVSAVATPSGNLASSTFQVGSLVFVSASPNTAAGFCFAGWEGNACQTQSNQNLTVSFNAANVTPNQSCIARFRSAGVLPSPSICPP